MTGTTEPAHLRVVITGLLGLAAAEEEMLLTAAAASGEDAGDARRWAAVPTVAHNSEFKAQQAQRIAAVLSGRVPSAFGEIDHGSAAVYAASGTRPGTSASTTYGTASRTGRWHCTRTRSRPPGTWTLPSGPRAWRPTAWPAHRP